MALADKAKAAAGPKTNFKKPDISSFISPGSADTVQRVVAAGMKIMYSPQMKGQMQQGIASQAPVPKNIADNTTGLLLTLDQKTQGGIPAPVLFPAAVELASEVATVLTAAGKPVSQDDFNDSLLIIYAQIGKKLGASDDQLMQHAQQAIGQQPDGADAAPPETPPGATPPPAGMPPGGAPPGGPPGMPPQGMPQ